MKYLLYIASSCCAVMNGSICSADWQWRLFALCDLIPSCCSMLLCCVAMFADYCMLCVTASYRVYMCMYPKV